MSTPEYPAEVGYPRNQWYVAAFSREVGRNLLARTLLDVPVVLFRLRDGKAVALLDRCPHRNLPLSMGKLVGDIVRCGYHGIEFDAVGKCTRIPQQDLIPPRMRVTSYPLVEKWQWLWIWMGDPAKADPTLIPDHYELGLEREGFSGTPFFTLEIKCNFQLLHENFLDSTHVTYMHEGAFDDGEMAGGKYSVEQKGLVVRLRRETPNVRPTKAVASYFHVREGEACDRIHIAETHVPSINIGKNTYIHRKTQERKDAWGMNANTPSTRRSCFTFTAITTSYGHEWSVEEIEATRQVKLQDNVALEETQRRYDKFGDKLEVSVKSDQGGLACRRLMTELTQAEAGLPAR